MQQSRTVKNSEVLEIMRSEKSIFICCASFEQRSMTIPSVVHEYEFEKVVLFEAVDSYPIVEENAKQIECLFGTKCERVGVFIKDPIKTSDSVAKIIRKLREMDVINIYLDVSTFTHEILLILLKQLYNTMLKKCNLIYIYNGASEYSINVPVEDKWLSKGCKEVRSVIGYPGKILPGRGTCLIVLVGFEQERATKLIVEMDPEFLALGQGILNTDHVTDENHVVPMTHFHRLVKDLTSIRNNVKDFEFSCKDPYLTYSKLKEVIQTYSDYNCIIAPLNTKISTIAISWIAFENPAIQICYAEPETYNYENYSRPSPNSTFFTCKELP